MKSFFKKRSVQVVTAIVLIVVVVGGSFWAGVGVGYRKQPAINSVQGLTNMTTGAPAGVDFSLFWKAWNTLNDNYVYATSTDSQNRVYGAIQGLAQAYGDPFTVFMPPAEATQFNTQISGSLTGVGMEIDANDSGQLVVLSPLKGSPAEAAGILAGDYILTINGTSTTNMSTDDAVDFIRGPVGTKVTLGMYSVLKKAAYTVTITRQVINLPTIDTTARPDGIFVISLYSFSATSDQDFRTALQTFVNSGDTKLILDLRGNPGGYLDAAVDMASFFLPKSDVVVSERYNGKQPTDVTYSAGYNIFQDQLHETIKMSILVDGGSASASEILTGALKDNGIAEVIGTQSYGKGSVQQIFNLTPDTNLKITIAHWYTPNGTSIQGKGITPDIIVPITAAQVAAKQDPQLDRAVQYLTTGK